MAGKQAPFSTIIVVVDVNILFSSLISPNGRLAKLLTDPSLVVEHVSCHYAIVELFKHQPKIVQYAKKPVNDVLNDLSIILRALRFYNETIIASTFWQEADRLTQDVDSFDISYVALTLQLDGWLWTGDKKLYNHLKVMGFEKVLNPDELYKLMYPSPLEK